jgi:predicted nuclease with TOPRIM domain
MVRNILLGMAGIYIIASIVFSMQLFNRFEDLERKQAAQQQDLAKKLDDSNSQNRASIDVLAERMGMTRQELTKRAAVLQHEQKAIASRVSADEASTNQRFGEVNGAVNGVKGDVGKVRDDVNSTRTDLDATKSRLEHAIGDLNRQSEMVATTHDELEQLKHRGDRNYYEFTLTKGKQFTHLATVGLQLKKADPKKNQFTLYVMADDKRIEKKDKTINEPLQFYTGRDHNLFEVVVNTVDKNTVSGYMATPKTVNLGMADQQQPQTN